MSQLEDLKALAKKNKWQLYTGGEYPELKRFRSGLITLDRMLGGGLPWGRVIEVFGPNNSGKTTLAAHVAGEQTRSENLVALIDNEKKLDVLSAIKRGRINEEYFLYTAPANGERKQ
jgi:recombination protein RecA